MRIIFIFFSILCLSGCTLGTFTSAHERTAIGSRFSVHDSHPVGVFVDAKQRAVLSNVVDGTEYFWQYHDAYGNLLAEPKLISSRLNTRRIVCAEPSPDALSAIAAQAGISTSELSKALAAQGALSESAANIGLRTQTIQTLRDGFYRVCEARMNGLSEEQYAIMLRRFQNNMIALLAIEQLTGAVKGPDVVLAASGGNASNIKDFYTQKAVIAKQEEEKYGGEIEALDKQLTPKTEAATKCEAQKDANPKPEGCSVEDVEKRNTEIAALKAQKGELEKKKQTNTDLYKAYTTLVESAPQGTPTTAAGAVISNAPNNSATKDVAEAVKEIAIRVLDQDYGISMCLEYLRANRAGAANSECQRILGGYANQVQANSATNQALQVLQVEALRAELRYANAKISNMETIRTAILADNKITKEEEPILKAILGMEIVPNVPQKLPGSGTIVRAKEDETDRDRDGTPNIFDRFSRALQALQQPSNNVPIAPPPPDES